MNHIGEDELLKYVLEISAGEAEGAGIEAHLKACSACRTRLESLRKDLKIISGIRPQGQTLSMRSPHRRHIALYSLLRAAALIILGIALGVSGSKLIQREPVCVSPAYLVLSPPADSIAGYAASDATQTGVRYYDRILDDRE
jgi:anti-sigma factor RsiW